MRKETVLSNMQVVTSQMIEVDGEIRKLHGFDVKAVPIAREILEDWLAQPKGPKDISYLLEIKLAIRLAVLSILCYAGLQVTQGYGELHLSNPAS